MLEGWFETDQHAKLLVVSKVHDKVKEVCDMLRLCLSKAKIS